MYITSDLCSERPRCDAEILIFDSNTGNFAGKPLVLTLTVKNHIFFDPKSTETLTPITLAILSFAAAAVRLKLEDHEAALSEHPVPPQLGS